MCADQNGALNEGGHAAPRVAEALPRGTAGCASAPACAPTQLIRPQRADALRTPRRRGHRDVGLDPHSRQIRGHSLEVNRRRQFDRAAHRPCRQTAGHRPLRCQWITGGTVSVCASLITRVSVGDGGAQLTRERRECESAREQRRLVDGDQLLGQIIEVALPMAHLGEPREGAREGRIGPALAHPGGVVQHAQRAQRLDQAQL